MASYQGGDRPRGPSLHNILKMLLSSNKSNLPASEGNDVAEDVDEPPDSHILRPETLQTDGPIYVKSAPVAAERKESLLTRALMNSPELLAADRDNHTWSPRDYTTAFPSYPYSNVSGVSTAELTSDGGLSPASSNAASPPFPSHFSGMRPPTNDGSFTSGISTVNPSESVVEASLGRKRCISFACGRKPDEKQQKTEERKAESEKDINETPRRRPTLTFACPCPPRQQEDRRERSLTRRASCRSRPRGSPAPSAIRRSQTDPAFLTSIQSTEQSTLASSEPENRQRGIPISGLGRFEPSEETRFHAFASSVDEEDEWVAKAAPEYKDKITLNDCMKKEHIIRKLGEEAEAEAQAEEEAEDEEDVADEDDSTVHDFSSDDGNESDNEAGFADSDDESDDSSEYEFWAPSTTAATSTENLELVRQAAERRGSNTSMESLRSHDIEKWLPAPSRRRRASRPMKAPKMRPGTPDLPDSTDFVCGTLDEDRPLEAAYISCMEQRRRSKHVPIPQDIDPSFPTTDPEDNDDLDDETKEEDEETARIKKQLGMFDEDSLRGRQKGQRETSPRHSPKRMLSPAPRLLGHSPKRAKSPAPPMMLRSSPNSGQPSLGVVPSLRPEGVNISGLVQRPNRCRTKSLPRTPNPFFTTLEKKHESSLACSPEGAASRGREVHTRGPIDIVEGLEKKRQKRKEKFWRQHCRKAAKEQMERRPTPGKGAERMKELGLEVAERCRAYGVGQNAQLVLSV
ncbi:hypothetical protein VTN00DRAFT_7836 [Thermoascus crustaceus]|uniref:uncharacterized protein n=1 Tax=Thermoascus crustaceus TaxID=5088 RepID=UPI003744A3DE